MEIPLITYTFWQGMREPNASNQASDNVLSYRKSMGRRIPTYILTVENKLQKAGGLF